MKLYETKDGILKISKGYAVEPSVLVNEIGMHNFDNPVDAGEYLKVVDEDAKKRLFKELFEKMEFDKEYAFCISKTSRSDVRSDSIINRYGFIAVELKEVEQMPADEFFPDVRLTRPDLAPDAVLPDEARKSTRKVELLLKWLEEGQCKGVKGATVYKIKQFAKEKGLV